MKLIKKNLKIFKKYQQGFQRKQGRNNSGKITCRHKGGGHSKVYRKINFQKIKIDIPGKIKTIEYDPNRTGRILGMIYQDGSKNYQLCPIGVNIGSKLIASDQANLTPGNSLPLKNIPLGTNVYNIESVPGRGGQFVRAGGTTATLMSKLNSRVILRLPSGEIRLFSENCWASIGRVQSNYSSFFKNNIRKKAGRSRWLGRRPSVRGSAQNAVDHPHGGGEGRAPIGRSHPVTPWGKPTLGKLTRSKKKYSNRFILHSRTNI